MAKAKKAKSPASSQIPASTKNGEKSSQIDSQVISQVISWTVVVSVLVLVALIRVRLLQIPLERDEGEFAYMGQLMLEGIPPYLIAYNMKLPGIYALYALITGLFGQTIAGIHLGLLLFNSAGTVLLFWLARGLFGNLAATVAAAVYAILSVSPSVLGTSAHATQFIVPFALGGTLLLLKGLDTGKAWILFLSGLAYGLSFLLKQHAVFFILFALVYFLWRTIWNGAGRVRPLPLKGLLRGCTLLMVGWAVPLGITCLLLYLAGVFEKFWFWTFSYAREYVSYVGFSETLDNFFAGAIYVIKPWIFIWLLGGLGLTAIFWNREARSHRFFLVSFAVFSFLTICPGFFFRPHYYITLLPVVALLAGVAVSSAGHLFSGGRKPVFLKSVPIGVAVLAMLIPFSNQSYFFFSAVPELACKMMYSLNPFPESIEIADYIREHSAQGDKIAVIGSEPQIYFYSGRKSATGYLYVQSLMEPQPYAARMQKEMIREIESARPRYIVFVNVSFTWLRRPDSDTTIFDWANVYLHKEYQVKGLINVMPPGSALGALAAYWGADAGMKKPASPAHLYVLERRS